MANIIISEVIQPKFFLLLILLKEMSLLPDLQWLPSIRFSNENSGSHWTI